MKNKKGFTLVELLAVIVILALIMSIAVVSIGGVLNSTRQSTFKETAVSIINGVRQQLTLANELEEGTYYFLGSILEKGGTDSPLGGTIQYISAPDTTGTNAGKSNIKSAGSAEYVGMTQIGTMGIYRAATAGTCSKANMSFVKVTKSNGTSNMFTYSICLTAGDNYYIKDGSETALLNSNDNSMIKAKNES